MSPLISTARLLLAKWSVQPLLLLCTGTAVAILAQHVNNQSKISPNAQLLVLARYVITFASSLVMIPQGTVTTKPQGGSKNSGSTQTDVVNGSARGWMRNKKVTAMLVLMGFLDLASYAIFNIGFAACGSALASVALAASGQIATAVISVAILHRHLSLKHVASVAVVTIGLALRALDGLQLPLSANDNTTANRSIAISKQLQAMQNTGGQGSGLHSQALYGVTCVVASGLLYSILGVMYEVLMSTDKEGRVSQAQATYVITGISLVATCAHQLLYSLPNWKQLVMEPVAASQYSGSSIAASHVLYGVVTAVHNYVQVKLLGSHGAMTLGLVNAVRASVVSFASSWLFCSSVAHLCLTYWKAASALVVTAGAALWVAAGKPPSSQQEAKAKQHAE